MTTETNTDTTPVTPPFTNPVVDVEALKIQIAREYEAKHSAKLKELTGATSLNELSENKLKAQGEYQKLAEQATSEVTIWKNKYNESVIRDTLVNASISNNAIDHEVLYSLIKSSATIDDLGVVTINGKSPTDYIKSYLSDKPYLIKPSTKQGSGTPVTVQLDENAKLKEEYDKAFKSGDVLKCLELKSRFTSPR